MKIVNQVAAQREAAGKITTEQIIDRRGELEWAVMEQIYKFGILTREHPTKFIRISAIKIR